jgi:23S rRNA (adenine2503-C2)-methyltransferase
MATGCNDRTGRRGDAAAVTMDLRQLDHTLAQRGEPSFRARQVWAWAARGASGYEQMTDLPASLRQTLARELPFSCLTLREQAQSSDGTVKALFATADDRPLEAVLMRYRDSRNPADSAADGRRRGRTTTGRRSICVSSQSGCPLTCRFCATGAMRFARNLTASEILDQALHFLRLEARTTADARVSAPASGEARSGAFAAGGAPSALTNCVFMGMGEPLMNLDNVLAACERLPDIGIAHRRTTISTVGWIPGIQRLARQPMPVRLALSLHAADEALRSQLMPVNERYPLSDVLAACREFYERKRRRVFVEYVMLAGVNDRYEQALALAQALAGGPQDTASMFKVNLIPYNPSEPAGGAPFTGSGRESIAAFRAALESRGVAVTVRLTRGRDIAAACGQLAAHAAAS